MGCSGYRVKHRTNPLLTDGIRSVAIPLFYNKSSFGHVSSIFTKEFVNVLSSFPDLKIYSTENSSADSVLIGILTSPSQRSAAIKTTGTSFTAAELKDSIGSRPEFYVPRTNEYKIQLQLILIKNPSFREIELIKSSFGKHIVSSSKVVFNKSFNLTGSFSREIKETLTADSSGITNQTKSKHYFESSLISLAQDAASTFRELILNVY